MPTMGRKHVTDVISLAHIHSLVKIRDESSGGQVLA